MMTSEDFDPASAIVLEGAGGATDRAGEKGTARIVPANDPGQVEIVVEAPEGGWLLLSDSWYPGWVVEVNGAPADGYPADVAFRAVWVPPGESTVVWTYRPRLAAVGAVVSLASLMLLGGILGRWLVDRSRAQR